MGGGGWHASAVGPCHAGAGSGARLIPAARLRCRRLPPRDRCRKSSTRSTATWPAMQLGFGGVGGLSALHHAARQGNMNAVAALLDGGANINEPSLVDHTTPLLMATINGQFDVAMQLIARGADPNIESTAGATPLYTTINTQWAPRSRFPQPRGRAEREGRLPRRHDGAAQGARESECADQDAPLVLRVQQLRQRQLRAGEPRGDDVILARGVCHRRRRDEAPDRIRRRPEHSARRRRWRLAAVAVVGVVAEPPDVVRAAAGAAARALFGRSVAGQRPAPTSPRVPTVARLRQLAAAADVA